MLLVSVSVGLIALDGERSGQMLFAASHSSILKAQILIVLLGTFLFHVRFHFDLKKNYLSIFTITFIPVVIFLHILIG